MERVFTHGTASFLQVPDISICGKTGTAENFTKIDGERVQLTDHSIFIAFAPSNLKLILIYLAFILIIGIYSFRVLRSLFLASKYISLHKFHFFMYLCTIEIAPVLILAKIIMLLTGIQ